MKALYRKYRPLKLEDVVGQEQVTVALKNAISQNKFSHAYLFTGPRGTGKTTVARIFAHQINGFSYELEDDYVDIIEIDGASNRGIDDIREIREKAMIKPTLGKYKVYIIDEVHMLTREAFNALLKTLEEPPKHVIFVMATTDLNKVPATILSRAQVYHFKLVDSNTILNHLKNICQKEHIKITDEALGIVVKRGGGSFRDSLSLLEQISTLSKNEIDRKMVEDAIGLPEEANIDELLMAYASGDVVKITTILKGLFELGVRIEPIVSEMIAKIIKNPTPEFLPLLDKLPDVKEPFADARLTAALLVNLAPTPAIKFSAESTIPKKPAPEKARSTSAKSSSETSNSETSKFKQFLLERAKAREDAKVRENNHEKIENPQNDTTAAKISDIIGGEVQEYGGGNPF